VIVSSHNEWGKLRSIVVGTASGANWPVMDPTFAINWETTLFKEVPHPKGPVPTHVIDEANEDLDELVKALQSAGVDVFRPMDNNYAANIGNSKWSSDQLYGYCPRDTHLVIGETVIEAPMSYRSRQMESDMLSQIRQDAMQDGANWVAAPRPILPIGTHYMSNEKVELLENEPIFDAANCLRLDNDILYLKSCTGNNRGADWLKRFLGSQYRIHVLDDLYAYAHIDSTIAPIREGLVVLNRSRVRLENMPRIFAEKKWDVIWFDDPVPVSFYKYPYASAWIGMNLLMIDPKTAIVDKNQTHLIKELEKNQIEVWAMELRHARTLGGGFHCVTLDLHRDQ
jgi:N-dimethylarginine dimethylaminohydrolase